MLPRSRKPSRVVTNRQAGCPFGASTDASSIPKSEKPSLWASCVLAPVWIVFMIITPVVRILVTIFHSIFPTNYELPKPKENPAWQPQHLESYRQIADPLSDTCYRILFEEYNREFPDNFDILTEINKRAQQEIQEGELGPFAKFYNETYEVPEWVDFQRIRRGAEFYLRVGLPGGASVLGGASLVQSYGAAKGSLVLTETGRLNDDVIKRIYETGDFLYRIYCVDGLKPGNAGHRSVLQVRLLHSAIRNYLTTRQKPWNSEELGIPINQEDLAGTVCLFTCVLLSGVTKLGYKPNQKEMEDYVFLWRWVGYLMGVRPELLPYSVQDSIDLATSIGQHQWQPTEESKLLVRSLFTSMQRSVGYFFLSSEFWQNLSRYLIGDKAADDLGIQQYNNEAYTGVLLLSCIIKIQSFIHHNIPLSSWLTVNLGRLYWKMMVSFELSGRTVDFKMKQY